MPEESKRIEDLFSTDMMVKASVESALYSAGQDPSGDVRDAVRYALQQISPRG